MNYKLALEALVQTHCYVWGCFFKPLPDFRYLSQQDSEILLLGRAEEMKKIINRGELAIQDLCRFPQEFDVVCLLLLICLWARVNENVPITRQDFEDIKSEMSNLCVAGVGPEEGSQDIFDIIKSLLKKGIESQVFPHLFEPFFCLCSRNEGELLC